MFRKWRHHVSLLAIWIRRKEISSLVARHSEESLHSYIDANDGRDGYGSGSAFIALSWAIARVVFQVAHHLHCPTTSDSELALCLRNQDVDKLLHAELHKPKYVPAYAPLIDRAVIPDKPFNLMQNAQLFSRYTIWKVFFFNNAIDVCVEPPISRWNIIISRYWFYEHKRFQRVLRLRDFTAIKFKHVKHEKYRKIMFSGFFLGLIWCTE